MTPLAAVAAATAVFAADQITKYTLPVVLTTSRGGSLLRLVFAAVLVWVAVRFYRTRLGMILAGMAGAGAGNVVDAVRYGHVRDVFTVGTAVFNVADVVLVLGLAVVAAVLAFHKPTSRTDI